MKLDSGVHARKMPRPQARAKGREASGPVGGDSPVAVTKRSAATTAQTTPPKNSTIASDAYDAQTQGGTKEAPTEAFGASPEGTFKGGLLALTNGGTSGKLKTPREKAQAALDEVNPPAADHPQTLHMNDIRERLAEKGLPTSAEGVRVHVMDATASGLSDSHGAQVTRALAGPVGPGQGADVLLENHVWITDAVGGYALSDAQAKRMDKASSLSDKFMSGDVSLDDAAEFAALQGERAIHEKRADLAHVVDSVPPGHEGTTIMNMSFGQSVARATDQAAGRASFAPEGSPLDLEVRAELGIKPDEGYTPGDVRTLLFDRVKTKVNGPHRAFHDEARTQLGDETLAARKQGVLVVRAAGNEALLAKGYGDPEASRTFADGVPGMITVGATSVGAKPTDLSDDSVTDFSAHGQVDISAPGIQSPVRKLQKPVKKSFGFGGRGLGAALARQLGQPAGAGTSPFSAAKLAPPKKDVGDTEGTSFSSPYIAGVAALMVKANPAITPDQIASIFADPQASHDIAGTTRDGTGVIDVVAAVQMAADLAHD